MPLTRKLSNDKRTVDGSKGEGQTSSVLFNEMAVAAWARAMRRMVRESMPVKERENSKRNKE